MFNALTAPNLTLAAELEAAFQLNEQEDETDCEGIRAAFDACPRWQQFFQDAVEHLGTYEGDEVQAFLQIFAAQAIVIARHRKAPVLQFVARA